MLFNAFHLLLEWLLRFLGYVLNAVSPLSEIPGVVKSMDSHVLNFYRHDSMHTGVWVFIVHRSLQV